MHPQVDNAEGLMNFNCQTFRLS